MMDQIQMGLSRLSPQELQRLDQLLSPELAALLVKVLPDLGPVLGPLVEQPGQPGQGGGMPAPQAQGPQMQMPPPGGAMMAPGAPPRPQSGLGQAGVVPPQFRR